MHTFWLNFNYNELLSALFAKRKFNYDMKIYHCKNELFSRFSSYLSLLLFSLFPSPSIFLHKQHCPPVCT